MKRLKLDGKRFGHLVVIEMSGKNEFGHTIWLCQCDCGNFCEVVGSNLMRASVISCGCLSRRKKLLPEGYNPFELREDDPRRVDGAIPKVTLCCDCGNYFCSWLQKHQPVEGWTAVRNDILTGRRRIESYFVLECPERTPMRQRKETAN